MAVKMVLVVVVLTAVVVKQWVIVVVGMNSNLLHPRTHMANVNTHGEPDERWYCVLVRFDGGVDFADANGSGRCR